MSLQVFGTVTFLQSLILKGFYIRRYCSGNEHKQKYLGFRTETNKAFFACNFLSNLDEIFKELLISSKTLMKTSLTVLKRKLLKLIAWKML